MAENSKDPEIVQKQTPTEASKGFLSKFTDRLFTDKPVLPQLLMHGVVTSQVGRLAVEDAMQGNYPSAVVEGMIAGVFLVSPIRMVRRITRPENNQQ